MLLVFLQAELSSVRFRDRLTGMMERCGVSPDVIWSPDLRDAAQNLQRRQVMTAHRGFGTDADDVFEHFPVIRRWEYALLDKNDLNRIKYIDCDYWNELSRGTGRPAAAVQTIREGVRVFGVPNDGFLLAAESLRRGVKFPPVVLLCAADKAEYRILEGHQRVTAYALERDTFGEAECIVGYYDRAARGKE